MLSQEMDSRGVSITKWNLRDCPHRLAPTSFRYAATPLSYDDDDRKIEEAVLFVLIKIICVIIFWARLVLWGGLPVVCERSMGVLWWFGALMDVPA